MNFWHWYLSSDTKQYSHFINIELSRNSLRGFEVSIKNRLNKKQQIFLKNSNSSINTDSLKEFILDKPVSMNRVYAIYSQGQSSLSGKMDNLIAAEELKNKEENEDVKSVGKIIINDFKKSRSMIMQIGMFLALLGISFRSGLNFYAFPLFMLIVCFYLASAYLESMKESKINKSNLADIEKSINNLFKEILKSTCSLNQNNDKHVAKVKAFFKAYKDEKITESNIQSPIVPEVESASLTLTEIQSMLAHELLQLASQRKKHIRDEARLDIKARKKGKLEELSNLPETPQTTEQRQQRKEQRERINTTYADDIERIKQERDEKLLKLNKNMPYLRHRLMSSEELQKLKDMLEGSSDTQGQSAQKLQYNNIAQTIRGHIKTFTSKVQEPTHG